MQVKRGFADLLAFLFDVDIVCINQADIGKKTDQVGIMGDLYGIATSVIVFPSEESDDSDLAIDFAEKAPVNDSFNIRIGTHRMRRRNPFDW
jgi:hypothetical protein